MINSYLVGSLAFSCDGIRGGGAGPDHLPAAGVHCAQGGGSWEGECGDEDSQAKDKLYGIDCPL